MSETEVVVEEVEEEVEDYRPIAGIGTLVFGNNISCYIKIINI